MPQRVDFLNFYWNRVALQCCVSFCCAAKWTSYTYPLFFRFSSHLDHHWVERLVLYSRFLLVIYFIHSTVYISIPISQFLLVIPISQFILFPPLAFIMFSLHLCLCFWFANKFICTSFLDTRFHLCKWYYTIFVFLCLTYFTLSLGLSTSLQMALYDWIMFHCV